MKKKKLFIVLLLVCMLGCGTKQEQYGLENNTNIKSYRNNSQGDEKTTNDNNGMVDQQNIEVNMNNNDKFESTQNNESSRVSGIVEMGGLSGISDVVKGNESSEISDVIEGSELFGMSDAVISNQPYGVSDGIEGSGPSGIPSEIDGIGPGKNDGIEPEQAPNSNLAGDEISSEPVGSGERSIIGQTTNEVPDEIVDNSNAALDITPDDNVQNAIIKGGENAGIDKMANKLKDYGMPSFIENVAPDKTGIYTQEWEKYTVEFRTDSEKNIYAGVISAECDNAVDFLNSVVVALGLSDNAFTEEDYSGLESNKGQYTFYLSQRGGAYIMQVGVKSYIDMIKG